MPSANTCSASAQTQPNRVLILEKDHSTRILFADYLEQCGYQVFPLADEQKILESLAKFQPHVLILNLKMSFVDGFSVIEQLRSHPQWQSLPILVVSGYSSVADRQKAYQLGANAYLTKPIFPVDLSEAVAYLIGTTPAAAPA
ncbi:MAG: response regulator [Phormidesmis sp.]